MKHLFALLLICLCGLSATHSAAQNGGEASRASFLDKHILRIELNEKANLALLDLPLYLLVAYEQGLLPGYMPENPGAPLGYYSLMRNFGYKPQTGVMVCNNASDGVELYGFNPLLLNRLEAEVQSLKSPRKELYRAFQQSLELVEDAFFDRQKSDDKFQLHYVRLVYKDPNGVRPEANAVLFHYQDVRRILRYVMGRNRQNQAERRNLADVLELRLFNGYQIENSGQGRFQSLQESEDRRRRAVERQENQYER